MTPGLAEKAIIQDARKFYKKPKPELSPVSDSAKALSSPLSELARTQQKKAIQIVSSAPPQRYQELPQPPHQENLQERFQESL
jgi:hypothetical protein